MFQERLGGAGFSRPKRAKLAFRGRPPDGAMQSCMQAALQADTRRAKKAER
jgi:hypothetical protein